MSGFKYCTVLVIFFLNWQLNVKANIGEFITYQPIISSCIPITDPAYSSFIIVKSKIYQLGYHRYTQEDIEFAWRVLYDFVRQRHVLERLKANTVEGKSLWWLIQQLYDCFSTAVGASSEEDFAHYLINTFINETVCDKLHQYEQCFYLLYKRLRIYRENSEQYQLLLKQWDSYSKYLEYLEQKIEQSYFLSDRINYQHVLKSLRFLLEMRRLSWQVFTSDCVQEFTALD